MGKDAEAKKLIAPKSAIDKQLQDVTQLPGFKELRIVKLYLGKHAVIGVTSTFQTDRVQQAVLVISARRKDNRYFIDDIDLKDPEGLRGEINRFVKDYGPGTFIDVAAETGPESPD